MFLKEIKIYFYSFDGTLVSYLLFYFHHPSSGKLLFSEKNFLQNKRHVCVFSEIFQKKKIFLCLYLLKFYLH
jgi:hypothetical protein